MSNKKEFSKFVLNGKKIKLDSITAHNTYGVPRSTLTYMIQNQFYFDKHYINCLETYYILQWQPKHFCKMLHDGIISVLSVCNAPVYSTEYQVIYHKTDPTKIKQAVSQEHSHVKLSFRISHTEFNIPPTVLIKLYTRSKGRISE